MPYPRKYLNPGETVVVDLHPHWARVAPPSAAVLVTAVAYLASRINAADRWVTAPLALVCILSGGWALLRWAGRLTTYFVVTSDRVIYREGLLTRTGVEIPLEKVNNVNFKQTLFERLLGAGDLLIESGGQDGAQRFSDIPAPAAVQNQLAMAIEGNDRQRYSSFTALASHRDDHERWLQILLEDGILSAAEHAAAIQRLQQR